MYCTRCGKEVEEGNRFCQFCGQDMSAPQQSSVVVAPVAAVSVPPPIAAPAAVLPPVHYAGFWIRFVAALVDGLILGIPFWIILFFVMGMAGGFAGMLHRMPRSSTPPNPGEVAAVVGPFLGMFFLGWLVFLVLEWLYYAGMESSARQGTIGKSLLSLKVTNHEGRRISFAHATGRFAGKVLNRFIPLAIGFIMAGFTEKKQALHDMIAGTLVVKS